MKWQFVPTQCPPQHHHQSQMHSHQNLQHQRRQWSCQRWETQQQFPLLRWHAPPHPPPQARPHRSRLSSQRSQRTSCAASTGASSPRSTAARASSPFSARAGATTWHASTIRHRHRCRARPRQAGHARRALRSCRRERLRTLCLARATWMGICGKWRHCSTGGSDGTSVPSTW